MFDLIAVEGGTLQPIDRAENLKLDQSLRFFVSALAYTAKTGKEVEIAIRKHY